MGSLIVLIVIPLPCFGFYFLLPPFPPPLPLSSSLPSFSLVAGHFSHCMHEETRGHSQVSFLRSHCLTFWESLSLAQNSQKALGTLQSLPPQYWDYTCAPPHPGSSFLKWVLGIKHWSSYLRGKYFIDWALSPVSFYSLFTFVLFSTGFIVLLCTHGYLSNVFSFKLLLAIALHICYFHYPSPIHVFPSDLGSIL